jgi:exonuclease SbcD
MAKLLCAADIHLGRQPSRVPASLAESLGSRRLSPRAAWFRLVDMALEQRVDAVVLAGDVVEQNDDFYEAYADLRSGVERLAAAGIPVVAVAGNHDVEVLPRLAEAVDGFTLLGEGGRWEGFSLEGGGRAVRLVGWSFPKDQSALDPLSVPLPARGSEPTIGVLHCDRDSSGSRYAPVRGADLATAEVDAWLLGHVHKPDSMTGDRPIGYLGSLTGMDPGESGPRGAWLLEVSTAGRLIMERIPLAPLRWEELEVSVEGLKEPDEVHGRIVAAMDGLDTVISAGRYKPEAVGIRLTLAGRSSLGERLRRTLQGADPRDEPLPRAGVVYFVHDWRLDILPEVDLEELSRSPDPAGLLAARLLLLRRPGESRERSELLRAARERLAPVAQRRNFQPLAVEPPGDEELSRLLESAALQALEALLAQKEPGA